MYSYQIPDPVNHCGKREFEARKDDTSITIKKRKVAKPIFKIIKSDAHFQVKNELAVSAYDKIETNAITSVFLEHPIQELHDERHQISGENYTLLPPEKSFHATICDKRSPKRAGLIYRHLMKSYSSTAKQLDIDDDHVYQKYEQLASIIETNYNKHLPRKPDAGIVPATIYRACKDLNFGLYLAEVAKKCNISRKMLNKWLIWLNNIYHPTLTNHTQQVRCLIINFCTRLSLRETIKATALQIYEEIISLDLKETHRLSTWASCCIYISYYINKIPLDHEYFCLQIGISTYFIRSTLWKLRHQLYKIPLLKNFSF